jgi:ATP-dependent DNA ligase
VTLPVAAPVEPMLAKLSREMPDLEGVLFEPKWDGFRCIVFRDGDALELQSRNAKPLLRYFPELRAPMLEQLPERCVLDGELVVATDHGLDFEALQLRQHPAESRIRKLAADIPASYVAFDLLALGDDSLLEVPFGERRARLEATFASVHPPLFLTPATRDRAVAREWFDRFEGAGFDGVMVKPLGQPYRPGERTMVKVKHERTVDCVVAGYRLHKDGRGVGSLLLGLYDGAGRLHHVGVASSLAAPQRARLLAELAPYRQGALDGHPWAEWAQWHGREGARAHEEGRAPDRRMPGGVSRWNAGKDLSFEPLRIELVAEVAYEGMQGARFRHNARLRRLRPDRDPATCTFEQLEVAPPEELARLVATMRPGPRS